MTSSLDAVIVGGGPAGLSAALQLARAQRSVLVIDAGEPRNARAEHMHGVLTRDGIAPSEFRDLARAEVEAYGVQIGCAEVVAVMPEGNDHRLTLADGSELTARALLLATGLTDTLPDIPGLAEHWGRTVFHCPYCHGYEVRGQRIAVLGTAVTSVEETLLLRQWSDRMTLLQHTAPPPNAEAQRRLAARGVAVVAGEVQRVEGAPGGPLTVVHDGGELECDALVVTPRTSARNPLVDLLGLELVSDDIAGDHVVIDLCGRTSVSGVYAAGNCTDPTALVVSSMHHGSSAGIALNADLVQRDIAAGLDEEA